MYENEDFIMMKNKVDIHLLLNEMTLEEKIGQLLQLLPVFFMQDKKADITGPIDELQIKEDDIWRSGSVIGVTNADDMKMIQKMYLEKSRTKIPLLFMQDVVHGFRTIFPIPLALGCSWDTECARRSAEIAGKEAAVSGVHVTFAPMVDLVRDPRWGRVMESTGEDPYLNGQLAKAFVQGFQENREPEYNISSCVKHFAAYGAAEAGRDYNTVDMSDRTLREYYLPAYHSGVKAGCKMVMAAFNTVHGIPCTGNSYLMRDILRKEWGFDGVIISDWGSVDELRKHGVAADGEEAAKLALQAGVDIEMMTAHYTNNLKNIVQENKYRELLDEAVLRILKLKEKMNLFVDPYLKADTEKANDIYVCSEHRKKAREIAGKSMVLLKNENVLPLSPHKKIALIGPFADNTDILGGWRALGQKEETISLLEGICSYCNKEDILIEKGCDIDSQDNNGFESAYSAVLQSEVVILAVGEEQDMSGEASCRAFLTLPGRQEELIEEIVKAGKPVIVVLFNGRPLDISRWEGKVQAVLEAWYPGTEGGNAAADILFGNVNPKGRLSMSFPRTVGQIPVYYNSYSTGRPFSEGKPGDPYLSKYLDIPNTPLYPFGYGLCYTEFLYEKITLSGEILKEGQELTLSVSISNIGKREGVETVQLYIRDIAASVVRPVKELKAFQQINLKPEEKKIVDFQITEEMLKFHNFKREYKAEPGEFQIMVGRNSEDITSLKFYFSES